MIAMAKEDRCFRKGELIIAAQPYSETSFTAVDINGAGSNFYNAWSGMATLINKDFVLKSGSPARLGFLFNCAFPNLTRTQV